MIKKKAKGKTQGKKPKPTKTKDKEQNEKELNPAAVRKDVSLLVESHAEKMAQAVINLGETGQLAPVKYLFEVANIFPPVMDGMQSSKDEDSLAKTLLDRLNIPTEPIALDDDEDSIVVIQAKRPVEEAIAESGQGSKEESFKEVAGNGKEVTAV